MTTFIPYHSERGTVDVTEADRLYREAFESKLAKMRSNVIRWVPILQFIQERRPEMHWCGYDGPWRVVAFIDLKKDESFGDLEEIYERIAGHVDHLRSIGGYGKTEKDFIARPDPEDDVGPQWRTWGFKAGDSTFQLTASFGCSQVCRIVETGVEMIEIRHHRVECGPVAVQQ